MARTGAKHTHRGHRKRMRLRALEEGLAEFRDHEAVELLLFESIPRRNTNETAHRLTDGRDTLLDALREDPRALQSADGIGPVSAQLVASVLPETAARLTDALRLRDAGPLDRWALLPLADLRLNAMGEAGAVLLLAADGTLTDWLPAGCADELLRTDRLADAKDPASRWILIREDAACALTERYGPLPACFPFAAKIGVVRPDHRMEGI